VDRNRKEARPWGFGSRRANYFFNGPGRPDADRGVYLYQKNLNGTISATSFGDGFAASRN
jgi:hypothetical protein